MGSTPTWALPYPGPDDHTRTWEHWQALAVATDAQLTAIGQGIPDIQTGYIALTVANEDTDVAVTFPRPFPTTPAPFANIATSSSFLDNWIARAATPTPTGMLVCLSGPNIAPRSVPVYWMALVVPAVAAAAAAAAPAVPEDGWRFATATCHTAGCARAGIAVPTIAVPDAPTDRWRGVVCGVCGQFAGTGPQ